MSFDQVDMMAEMAGFRERVFDDLRVELGRDPTDEEVDIAIDEGDWDIC